MKIGTMLKDIVVSFFKKNATQLYPIERTPAPERFRGNLQYNPAACTGCCLCVKDCPSKAIELVTLDRAAKRFVLKYHMDRCIYCGRGTTNTPGRPNSSQGDHLAPRNPQGGGPRGNNSPENVGNACQTCNASKSNWNPIDWIKKMFN